MAHGMTRREFTAAAAGAATLSRFGLDERAKADEAKTLRFIRQTDVQVLDPIFSWPTGRFHLVEDARRGNHGLTTARDPGNVG